ncbi:hypothetical protein HGM15179_000708 [Zosterops borbonicus]|uniref:Uncharacterized protein n=1 Tax=Zosterops borbonicus TaxID=364589 RepID=A0A8K1GVT0_9PASS|nr:hypothetical protein HGM15179_000708 [Zosterops borbonicus]
MFMEGLSEFVDNRLIKWVPKRTREGLDTRRVGGHFPKHLAPAVGETEGCGPVGASPEEGHEIDKRIGAYEDRLRNVELFSLEKSRLYEDLTATFQFLKQHYKEAREGLFVRNCSDRQWVQIERGRARY